MNFLTIPLLSSFVIGTFFSTIVYAAPLIPAPPQLAAEVYLLIDADTNKVLVDVNGSERIAPASLAKMLTGYVVSEEIAAGRLGENDLVRISDDAWVRGGTKSGNSTMFLKPRSEVKVIDLLYGLIVPSGADAAIALAQHIAGSEEAFADVMNQQAVLLGMTDSHFSNATGLAAEDQYSTAYDLAKLGNAVIKDHPEHYKIYSEREYRHNGITQQNRNILLNENRYVDGIKTGYLSEVGYCLVASAKRDGMRLISVVMGANSKRARASLSQRLLDYGFRYYRTHTLYSETDVIAEGKVWKAEREKIPMGVREGVQVTIPRGSHKDIKAEIHVDSVIEAPIKKGQVLGALTLHLEGELLKKVDLVAQEEIVKAGIFSSMWDSVILLFVD